MGQFVGLGGCGVEIQFTQVPLGATQPFFSLMVAICLQHTEVGQGPDDIYSYRDTGGTQAPLPQMLQIILTELTVFWFPPVIFQGGHQVRSDAWPSSSSISRRKEGHRVIKKEWDLSVCQSVRGAAKKRTEPLRGF